MTKPLILSVSAWRGRRRFLNQVLTDASQMPEALRGDGRRDDVLQAAEIIEQLLEQRERLLASLALIVDRDLSYFDGFVMAGQIKRASVRSARDVIRDVTAEPALAPKA